MRKKNQQN